MSQPKRFKRDFTLLEELTNELFIEIFAYLNGVDTVYAFSQLNARIQSLLIQYVNIFDFKSINKAKFDYVIQHHDIHTWRSLHLSDDDQTPGQIKLFCQLYPPDQYLSQLKSLSALNMTPNYAREFISQLASFDNLVSLEIGNICGEIIQRIELPSLKRLVMTACKETAWMMKFHSLEDLEYNIECSCHRNYVLTLPTTLKHLKLVYDQETDVNIVQPLLRQLPRLTKLTLYDKGNLRPLPDGKTWEKLIQSSLPLLNTFQFCFHFQQYNSTLNDINQAVASFSTPFYLFEKRWFIRCYYSCLSSVMGILYSLPFVFSEMPINITSFDTSMSTLIGSNVHETKYESYENVKVLLFNTNCHMPHRAFLTSNIVRLVLKTVLPTSWFFLLINLRHLEFEEGLHMPPSDFSHFLSNIPQLQSLTVPLYSLAKLTDNLTNNAVCDQLSDRIKSLTITDYHGYANGLGIVSVYHLSRLVRIFGKTCEHLALRLGAHPNTILSILRRMQQLHSLHIYYVPWHDGSKNTATCWVEETRKKSDVSDFMYAPDDHNFYIWFGKRL